MDVRIYQMKSRFLLQYNCLFFFTVLQLLMLQPSVVRQESDPPSLKALIMDPYILIAAGMKFLSIQLSSVYNQ